MKHIDYELTVQWTTPWIIIKGGEFETRVSRWKILDHLMHAATTICKQWCSEFFDVWDYSMRRVWDNGGWTLIAFHELGVDGPLEYTERDYEAVYVLQVSVEEGKAFAKLWDVTSAGVCFK